MKQETFYRANDLQNNISQLKTAIDKAEKGDILNVFIYSLEDKEQIEKSVLRILKSKLAKYQKEFNNLK